MDTPEFPEPSGYPWPSWNEVNAQDIVTLKSREESGIWDASVRDLITAA
jgi:hypothetical protein